MLQRSRPAVSKYCQLLDRDDSILTLDRHDVELGADLHDLLEVPRYADKEAGVTTLHLGLPLSHTEPVLGLHIHELHLHSLDLALQILHLKHRLSLFSQKLLKLGRLRPVVTVFSQVLAFKADDLLLEFAVVSLHLLQCLFESLKAPLVAKLQSALLLLTIIELAFKNLHATLKSVQITLVCALSLF